MHVSQAPARAQPDPCPLQFFSDVREAEEQLRKLQETLRRKYTCDRSITVTRLEDLLQDAQVSGRCRWGVTGAAGRAEQAPEEGVVLWAGRFLWEWRGPMGPPAQWDGCGGQDWQGARW